MPDDELVVSNTSPLLNLALIDRLDLLESQFPTIVVPEQVWDELLEGEDGLEVLRELRDRGFLTLEQIDREDLFVELTREIDAGEAGAITYAIERDADLTLLDERDARRVARRHGLTVTGVIGVLLRGEREGTVDLTSELDALREQGFWIAADLYDEVVERAGKDG